MATVSDRFLAQVQKGHEDECWPWVGAKDNHGYGQLQVKSGSGRWRPVKAHRVAWFLAYGVWPTPCGLHRCDNPSCVNVNHLFKGSRRDNTADMMLKGRHNPVPRISVCKRGHPMVGSNVRVSRLRTRNNKVARSSRACKTWRQQNRKSA